MSISFNLIPNVLYIPGHFIEYDKSRALTGLAALPNKVLLIGAQHSVASGDGGTIPPLQIVQCTKQSDGVSFYGQGSPLTRMIEKFKATSTFTDVYAIGIDMGAASTSEINRIINFRLDYEDGANVVALGTPTSLASSGTVQAIVHGQRAVLGVTSGQTVAQLAAAWIVSYNALPNNLYVATAGAASYLSNVASVVVTLTARTAGLHYNAYQFATDYELSPTERGGLSPHVTITNINAAAANGAVLGAGVPDEAVNGIAAVIAIVGDEWFTKWVSCFTDNATVSAVEAELSVRQGPLVQQDSMQYLGGYGATYSDVVAITDGLRNSEHTTIMSGGSSHTTPEEWAATVAAVDSNEPDPARPRQTLKLPGLLPPARAEVFLSSERNLLLGLGLSTFKVGDAGDVFIERLVTTYQTDANSIDDPTFLNVTTMHTLMALRYTMRLRLGSKYPRHKLADDGTNFDVGQAVATQKSIKAEVIGLFTQWERAGLVEDFEQFASELLVERDETDKDRVNIRLGPNLINAFRISASQIQFIL